MSLRDLLQLRPILRIDRELSRLNDNLEAALMFYGIPAVQVQRAAMEAAEREAADVAANPGVLNFPSPLEEAVQAVKERLRRGELVDDEELLAAGRAVDELEEELNPPAW